MAGGVERKGQPRHDNPDDRDADLRPGEVDHDHPGEPDEAQDPKKGTFCIQTNTFFILTNTICIHA